MIPLFHANLLESASPSNFSENITEQVKVPFHKNPPAYKKYIFNGDLEYHMSSIAPPKIFSFLFYNLCPRRQNLHSS